MSGIITKLSAMYCTLNARIFFFLRTAGVTTETFKSSSVSQDRKKALEEMIGYYRFCSSCEEFQSWMKDKENIFRTLQPQADNVEVVQQKYQVPLFPAYR